MKKLALTAFVLFNILVKKLWSLPLKQQQQQQQHTPEATELTLFLFPLFININSNSSFMHGDTRINCMAREEKENIYIYTATSSQRVFN